MKSLRKKLIFSFGVALAILWLPVSGAVAQETMASGFTSDFVAQLERVEKQITSLEGAVPQDKFTWRPAEGVRSISEVYLHLADANYLMLSFAGAKSPFDMKTLMDQKTREGSTTERAKIAEALSASFKWTKETVGRLSDADLEKKVDFFGGKSTVRNVLLTLLSHIHEHLGQSIAYARSNGVVPPWTAERQARSNRN